MLSLAGRVAVVTGVSGGIAAATALALARAGARVAAVDPDSVAATRTAGQIEAEGGEARAIAVELTEGRAVGARFDRLVDDWGRLDVLVNAADSIHAAAVEDLSDAALQEAMGRNLLGAAACTRAAVPHMKQRGRGRILSGTSAWSRLGGAGLAAYAAAKAGIIGLTRVWARELGPAGLTANCVAPGLIAPEAARTLPPDELQRALARIPARRVGTPEEVAAVYLFLASDLAAFINGAVVGVDGGLLLY